MSEEGLSKTSHSKIFIGKQLDVDLQTVDSKIKMLDEAVDSGDSTKIMTALSLAVPTYTPDFK